MVSIHIVVDGTSTALSGSAILNTSIGVSRWIHSLDNKLLEHLLDIVTRLCQMLDMEVVNRKRIM